MLAGDVANVLRINSLRPRRRVREAIVLAEAGTATGAGSVAVPVGLDYA